MARINLVQAQSLIDEEYQEYIDRQLEAEYEEQRIQDTHDQWDREWAEKHAEELLQQDYEDEMSCYDPYEYY